VIFALLGLAIALQTVVLLVEELGDFDIADRMIGLGQLPGQSSRALADPPERRFRVTTGSAVDQTFQRGQQTSVAIRELFPAPACSTYTPFRREHPFAEFPDARGNGLP